MPFLEGGQVVSSQEGAIQAPDKGEGRRAGKVEEREVSMKTVSLERMDRIHLEMNPPSDR